MLLSSNLCTAGCCGAQIPSLSWWDQNTARLCENIEVQGINGEWVTARARFSTGTSVRPHKVVVYLFGKQELQFLSCKCACVPIWDTSFSVCLQMHQEPSCLRSLQWRQAWWTNTAALESTLCSSSCCTALRLSSCRSSGACMTLLLQLVLAFMCQACVTWCTIYTVSCLLSQQKWCLRGFLGPDQVALLRSQGYTLNG